MEKNENIKSEMPAQEDDEATQEDSAQEGDETMPEEDYSLEALAHLDNPQEILFHLSNEFPDIFAEGLVLFNKEMSNTTQKVVSSLSHISLSESQKECVETKEGLMAAFSCLDIPQLMEATGAWTADDMKIYRHYNLVFARGISNSLNAQFQQMNVPVTLEPLMANIPFELVVDLAESQGNVFSHNQEMVSAVVQLKKDLDLYALGYMNLQGQAFRFDDGTPPWHDWACNKSLQEMEEIVLYNSFMIGNHLMVQYNRNLANMLPSERQKEKPFIAKYGAIWALGNQLAANRLAESGFYLGQAARSCLYDDPRQFVQMAMMHRLILTRTGAREYLSDFQREAALHHVIKSTRQAVQDCYRHEPETAGMILGWYNYGTRNVEARLSPKVRQTEMIMHWTVSKNNNNSNSGRMRDQ